MIEQMSPYRETIGRIPALVHLDADDLPPPLPQCLAHGSGGAAEIENSSVASDQLDQGVAVITVRRSAASYLRCVILRRPCAARFQDAARA